MGGNWGELTLHCKEIFTHTHKKTSYGALALSSIFPVLAAFYNVLYSGLPLSQDSQIGVFAHPTKDTLLLVRQPSVQKTEEATASSQTAVAVKYRFAQQESCRCRYCLSRELFFEGRTQLWATKLLKPSQMILFDSFFAAKRSMSRRGKHFHLLMLHLKPLALISNTDFLFSE